MTKPEERILLKDYSLKESPGNVGYQKLVMITSGVSMTIDNV